jgi:hypothetical protein
MKRTFLLMLFSACMSMTQAAETRVWTSPIDVFSQMQHAGIDFFVWGYIGGAHCEMEMNGMNGTFEYAGLKRKLKFVSYNKRTKQLVLNEYDQKGRYIGKFVGHYEEFFVKEKDMTCMTYAGTFTNSKGKKTEFSMYYD